MRIQRTDNNPIITSRLHESVGDNINGPSLIRVPDWVDGALGRYYLYFADHGGTHIRLAYADRLEGPWAIHPPGALRLEDSHCVGHIASPDVHVDEERREIRMYYHGPVEERMDTLPELASEFPMAGRQRSLVAQSSDGLHFAARPETLGTSYFRVFRWGGLHYALGMPGVFFRSRDGLTGFERGPRLFTDAMRHSALLLEGDVLHVFYSNAGDCPESILHSTVRLTSDWMAWDAAPGEVLAAPETEYEGADLPLAPSRRGGAPGRVRQLRDPCVFWENGRTFLLYSVAGESGIALAELFP